MFTIVLAKMINYKPIILCVISCLCFGLSYSQEEPREEISRTVIPGSQYKAGPIHRFFLGNGYRDVWTSEISLPVLDLQTYAGGLIPIKKGGGMQTISLRFMGADSLVYTFRSVDKFPGKALPEEMQGTIIESWGKDQIGLMLPFGASIVSYLADIAGVLQSRPYYCVMPDDPALGKFRETFAGLVGALDQRADEGPDDTPGFRGFTKIVNTYNLSERLDESPDHRLDEVNFLEARLLDLLVGDWDRHGDQWRWARVKKNGVKYWRPVARDRDFSFVVYDGFFPTIMDQRWAYTNLDGYQKKNPDVGSLGHNSRHLDTRMLSGLSWPQWEDVLDRFLPKMTDAVLKRAVRQLPDEVHAIVGDRLTGMLLHRRDNLREVARDFYLMRSTAVDIQTTHMDEIIRIQFLDGGRVSVSAATKKEPGSAYYSRLFLPDETRELRIFVLDGDDEIRIEGEHRSTILCRLIGGKGDDKVIHSSEMNKIYTYDTTDGMEIKSQGSVTFLPAGKDEAHDRPPVGYPESRFLRTLKGEKLPPPYDYGYTWRPQQYFGIDRDNGVFIGGGIQLTKWGFRADPYVTRHRLVANFAARTGAFNLEYEADFYNVIPGARMVLNLQSAVPENRPNFFGFGNATEFDEELEENDFYRARQKYIRFENRIVKSFSQAIGWFGVVFQYLESELEDAEQNLLSSQASLLYGTAIKQTAGFISGFSIDTRDNTTAPTVGLYMKSAFAHFPAILENKADYTRINIDMRGYQTIFNRITMAARSHYASVSGSFPYYHAAYLGGAETLRGFNYRRFAGDRAFSCGLDFRFLIDRITFIFPSDFGIVLFGDAGRVWVNNESPGEWHPGYGGGFYLAPLLPSFTFSANLATSKEALFGYVHLGFAF